MRSLALNCFFQTVILLYLVDSGAAWVVRASNSVGLAIEYWKLAKAANVGAVRDPASGRWTLR